MGRKRKPAPGPSQRSISDFYRSIQAVAEHPDTDSELEYQDENIPEVLDLMDGESRGRPPVRREPEPDFEPEEEEEDEAPSVSRPRRSASRRRPPSPSPPPGDSSGPSSSSSSPEPPAWEPSRDDYVLSDGKIQMKVMYSCFAEWK